MTQDPKLRELRAKQLAESLYETTRLHPNFTVEVTFPPGTWVVDALEQALTIPGVKVGLRKL